MRRFIAWGVMVLFCGSVLVGCSSKAKEPEKVTAKKSASEQRMSALVAVVTALAALGQAGPPDDQLDAALQSLRSQPCATTPRADRKAALNVIQAAADALTPEAYAAYEAAWSADPAVADAAEGHGVLRYLSSAEKLAIADIRATKVARGAAVWFLYNMGYVVKTPDACFGIDVHCRRAVDLVSDLDFLLVTHEHSDHADRPLMQAMVDAGKPVVSQFFDSAARVNGPCELWWGPIRVKIDLGDHHMEQPGQTDNMLMYQVDCGESANGFVLYHSGDGNNYQKMHPDCPIDAYVVHVRVGMSVEAAIAHLEPKVTLLSHVLELAHSPRPPQAWRWSFASAFETVPNQPEDAALLLTWGERWLAPGTELAQN